MKKDIHTKGIIEEDIELSAEDLTDEEFQDVAPSEDSEDFFTEIGDDDEDTDDDVDVKDGNDVSQKKDHRFKKNNKGRKKGLKEEHKRLSISTKDKLMDIISRNMDDFAEILDSCKKENPTKFLDIMKDMTKYIAPTLASVTAEVEAEGKLTIEQQLRKLSSPRVKEEEQ